jgi:hypothetical protein
VATVQTGSATPLAQAFRPGVRARWRAARDARIARPTPRRRLAEDLEQAIERAERLPAPFSSAVPVDRRAVREAHGALLDLAERLRAPRAADPAGVRLARALLTDGGGPLYVPGRPGDLRAAALRALFALDGPGACD